MTDRLRQLLDPKRLQNGPEAWQRESPACAEMRVRIVREAIEAICDAEEPNGDCLICRSDAQAIRHYVALLTQEPKP